MYTLDHVQDYRLYENYEVLWIQGLVLCHIGFVVERNVWIQVLRGVMNAVNIAVCHHG